MTLFINKKIHQTWKDKNIPNVYHREWRESWKECHPDWSYKLWTDHEIVSLGKAFGMHLENFPGVCKADIGRYLIMYSEGGIYADLDYECFRDLTPLLTWHHYASCWDSPPGTPHRSVNQAWLASEIGEKFFLTLAKTAYDRWNRGIRPIERATAQWMVTEIWNHEDKRGHLLSDKLMCPIAWQSGRSISAGTLKVDNELKNNLYKNGAYAATYWTHNWRSQ